MQIVKGGRRAFQSNDRNRTKAEGKEWPLKQARGQMDRSRSEFQSILGENPDDGPSRALWERCREYSLEEPPSNWDGVFVQGP